MVIFLSNKKINALKKDIQNQQDSISEYILQYDKFNGKIPEYCSIQGGECTSNSLLIWEKDLQHRYTYTNMKHCNDFFQLSITKIDEILGKTDCELIPELVQRTGIKNTFGKRCGTTDTHTISTGKICRYWEFGYIGNRLVILDIRKKPILKNNKIIGTRGWASDLSNGEEDIKTLLEIYLKKGIAKRMDKNSEEGVAAYLIKEQNNAFNWHFPL